MDSTWNTGSIGIAGPPLRGPSSPRLLAEPPLSPPVSAGPAPTASAQPLQPSSEPLTPPATSTPVGTATGDAARPESPQRPAATLEALLMRFRLITSEQLDEALREKAETGKDVGAIVVERGWVNEDQLARLLTYAPAFPAAADAVPAASAPPAPAFEPAVEAEPVAAQPEPLGPEMHAEPAGESVSEPVAEPVAEQAAEAVAEEPPAPVIAELAPVRPALEAPAVSNDLAPALELIEPEPELEPVSVAPDPVATEPVPVVAESEPVAAEPEAVAADPEPVVAEPFALTFEPVSTPEPEPVAHEPEPEIEPVAAAPEPVVALPEPEPEPQPETEPEVAAEAQVVRFVEPPAIETIARVFVRLSNGERVEAGSFDDVAAAKARAEAVVGQVSNSENGWPFFGGRYIRPEAIVSVDVDATVVRYA